MTIENKTWLIYDDQIADATVTCSASFDPALQNIKDRRLQKIARTADSAITIEVVFDQDEYIGGVAILNTNVSDNAVNTWIAYSDDSFTTVVGNGSFIQTRQPSPVTPVNLYSINDNINSRGQNVACRSMRFILSVDSGDIYIGRIYAGRVFTPSNGGKFGSLKVSSIDSSSIVRALDGTPYITERARYRESAMEFHALTEQETYVNDGTGAGYFECLYDIERRVASSSEVVLIPMLRGTDTEDARVVDGQSIYGIAKWGATEQYEKCAGTFVYRKTIEVTESV